MLILGGSKLASDPDLSDYAIYIDKINNLIKKVITQSSPTTTFNRIGQDTVDSLWHKEMWADHKDTITNNMDTNGLNSTVAWFDIKMKGQRPEQGILPPNEHGGAKR